ncbi:DNA adenine methylase [Desulfurivibrio sp. D14AmB]|uniref:DNA adenine methylase n=1 Tax=Desulfurivibrio sp. D14AmB TaxID=3374370 RepID=UPI00376F4570
MPLKAPFPYFGGKARIADMVWQYLGDIPNYIEPFAGSLAVLLARPSTPKVETVNDADCMICNFWRSVKADATAVAQHADWPVNEADLHARHHWLTAQLPDLQDRLFQDPEYFDAKIAGWWVWGVCAWIGGGWCSFKSQYQPLPHLANGGRGVHALTRPDLPTMFKALENRLRRVRVCCGDWTRVLGDSVTVANGITGIFLDPPYAGDRDTTYGVDNREIAAQVRDWAIANGDNPKLRIALCGYDQGELMPAGWQEVSWEGAGYGRRGNKRGKANLTRERVWFSPHCRRNLTLFEVNTAVYSNQTKGCLQAA